MRERLCMHDDGYPAEPGKRKCIWHLLLKMPTEEQIEHAERRRAEQDAAHENVLMVEYPRARVGKAGWPVGERFCAGCQGFVPLFYASGSRCRAHNALAAHSGRLETTYGITRDDYVALQALQKGVCYVCGQTPRTKRLAVDHDHKTGEVRGLLCADLERGCNHAVLGSLEARSVDGVIAAAYRLIEYMQKTPFQRLQEARRGTTAPSTTTELADDPEPSPAPDVRPGDRGGEPAHAGEAGVGDPRREGLPAAVEPPRREHQDPDVPDWARAALGRHA